MITVVLVEPQYSGNIGSACRVMKNFGFSQLELVNPCELDFEAEKMAVHAKDILENAKISKKFDFSKYDYIVGTTCRTTARDDRFTRIAVPLEDAAKKLGKVSGNIALLFGSEPDGLDNEIIEKCDLVLTVPTKPAYKSMNLSHAVAIVLYELSRNPQPATRNPVRIACARENQIVMDNIDGIVKKIGQPTDKQKVFKKMFRKLLGRALVTGREANTLIGVLKKINKKLE